MEYWIPVTIAAALAQALRFTLQKKLKQSGLTTTGATFARFVYSAPIVALIALGYSRISQQPLPPIQAAFWPNALIGGLAQILATMSVVALFSFRNFAVGITLKKTEVLMSVPFGIMVLGETISALGLVAIVIGLAGVLLLSDQPHVTGSRWRRVVNPATGLGLAAGVLFAISATGYRGASLSLGSGDAFQRAVVTLAWVTAFQLAVMAAWLHLWDRPEIAKVIRQWRVAAMVGLTSMIGSICWFTAFTLQTVPYVKALGQIELVFSLIIGWLVFSERVTAREIQGLVLLAISLLVLVLAS